MVDAEAQGSHFVLYGVVIADDANGHSFRKGPQHFDEIKSARAGKTYVNEAHIGKVPRPEAKQVAGGSQEPKIQPSGIRCRDQAFIVSRRRIGDPNPDSVVPGSSFWRKRHVLPLLSQGTADL
jgi:hypothetical protein